MNLEIHDLFDVILKQISFYIIMIAARTFKEYTNT